MNINLTKAPKVTPPTIGELKMAISIYYHERVHLDIALTSEDDQSIEIAAINVGRATHSLNLAIEGAMAIADGKGKDPSNCFKIQLFANQKAEIANLKARLADSGNVIGEQLSEITKLQEERDTLAFQLAAIVNHVNLHGALGKASKNK
jgi:hypothetical protein